MFRSWTLFVVPACSVLGYQPVVADARDAVPVPPPNPFAGHSVRDLDLQRPPVQRGVAPPSRGPAANPPGPPPVPPPRPRDLAPVEPSPAQIRPMPSAPAASPSDLVAACRARLEELDIEVMPVATKPAAIDPVCVVAVPVVLVGVGRRSLAQPVALEGQPELDCAMAEAFGRFVREIAAPLAKGATGTALKSIVAAGYQCRANNRMPSGGHISAHATGIALDIATVRLADGRAVDIGKPADAAIDAFVAGMRKAACGYFTTVLGPGTDAAHADHLHVDIMHHGTSTDDHYRICQ